MRKTVLCCALATLTITGCTVISVLSGPRDLIPGDTATYVLSLDGPGYTAVALYLVCDVPASWDLLANSFTGTIGGVPVSGTGTVVGDPYPSSLPPPGDGFQRIWITNGTHTYDADDNGEATVDFAVNDVPAGEFALKFWLVAANDVPGTTGSYAAVTVNRESRLFAFVEALFPVDGVLDGMPAGVVSPDGRTLMVGGYRDSTDISLSNFARDPLTGELAHIEVLDDPVIPFIDAVAFAPGSDHAYGVGGPMLACYDREPTTGFLTRFQLLESGVGGVTGLSTGEAVATSPDGANVYVAAWADNAVSVFSRNPVTGELSFVEAQVNGMNGVQGLEQARDVVVSSDGANVYACGGALDTIAVFDRDQTTGELSFSQVLQNGVGGVTGMEYARALAVSADGGSLYVVGSLSDGFAVFARNPGSGLLTFSGAVTEGVDGAVGIMTPQDLALSPDDRHLFVAGINSLAVFSRDPSTNDLTFLQVDFDDEGGVVGLGAPSALTISPDGHDVYRNADQEVAVFSDRVFADGFELGNASRWDTTSP